MAREVMVVRFTAKERVLLHLTDYTKHADAVEVPPEMTQEGIALAAGFDLAHFSEYVRPLMSEGLARERQAHVRGIRQRRKVYDLTETGRMAAIRLRERLNSEVVRVREPQGIREATVAEVVRSVGGKASLLGILRQSTDAGIVDPATLAPSAKPAFVEMLAEAPRVGTFVGRHAELEEITREGGGPRVFVIRGVAGIGKSTLAAKACDLVRGTRNRFWHRVRPWDTLESLLLSVGGFLAALGKPGVRAVLGRGDTTRATQIFREDLPGTKSLLVFDDVHEAPRDALAFFRLLVDTLAESPDVRVLILSRTKLPFYNRRDVVLGGLVREYDLAGLGPEEIRAFLVDDERPSIPNAASRDVGGHPLFLELLRAHRRVPSLARRDIRGFVEEEIYEDLSEAERGMMKLASLYQTSFPRDALLADPAWSHDVLLSLSNRSLLRPVGEEWYEAHDTIRDVFADLLTPSERRDLGTFAVGQLRQLGSKALEAKDFPACINYYSNALQLSPSPAERVSLWESLGDANQRLGNLPATWEAYREAIEAGSEPELLARLHRKMADVLLWRGEVASASAEVDAGFEALGDRVGVERAWLDLLRCRTLAPREPEEAREHGEAALRVFQQVGDVLGQASALGTLGELTSRSDPILANKMFGAALGLAETAHDSGLTVDLLLSMSGLVFRETEDAEKVARSFAAIEALPDALEDPYARESFFMARSQFRCYVLQDFEGAAVDVAEAVHTATQIQDRVGVAGAEYVSAALAEFRGNLGEARRSMEKAREIYASLGHQASVVNTLFWEGLFCIMQGDHEGFQRISEEIAKAVTQERLSPYSETISGLARLVEGDAEGARVLLDRAVRNAEELRVKYAGGFMFASGGYTMPQFCYGAALQALGLERDADVLVQRALDLRRHNRAWIARAPEQRRLLVEGLQRMMRRGPNDASAK